MGVNAFRNVVPEGVSHDQFGADVVGSGIVHKRGKGVSAVMRLMLHIGSHSKDLRHYQIPLPEKILCFSVMVDFVDYLILQSAAASDIDIASVGGNAIPRELLASIRRMEGVKEVYGRRSAFDIPARRNGNTGFSGTVDLISYDDFALQCLKKDGALKRGSDLSEVYGDSPPPFCPSDFPCENGCFRL